MFRSSRWRSDKNKIRVVFKLQFHASQVPESSVHGLVVSVVPGDTGKATVRSEKASVQNGSCRWENPVQEAVKFVRDSKTGKISERIYHFIVSSATNGSTKSCLFGDVSLDFATYADSIKSSVVSLPLKRSNSQAILHVTIQRQHENGEHQSEAEENVLVNMNSEDASFSAPLSSVVTDGSLRSNLTEDGLYSKAANGDELRRRSSIGSDCTRSSYESSSGLYTPREIGSRANNSHNDQSTVIPKLIANGSTLLHEEPPRSEWVWSGGSDHGRSTDDSTSSSQDILPGDTCQPASDIEIEKLKTELLALTRQVDVSELELQTLRKQIVKESKKGQDLSREVVSLKEERDSFKTEYEKLKDIQERIDAAKNRTKLQSNCGDPWILIDEIRQELNYEKELNSNLRVQLEKTQDSNAELILAVQDLEAMLEEKNNDDVTNPSGNSVSSDKTDELSDNSCRNDSDDDEDQKALEELVKEHRDGKEIHVLEAKITELFSEVETYKKDKDELELQMEQLALDYEILKQENHEISYKLEQSQMQEQLNMQSECSSSFANIDELESQIESLENELKKQSKEYSDSLASTKELETQIKSLEEEMDKQAQRFETDLEVVTCDKVKQEQRAIRAEEALRKTRWKNADIAQKLQEEFMSLSKQMAGTFDANEKMAMKAMTEASEIRAQKNQLEEILKNVNHELQTVKDNYEAKLLDLSALVSSKTTEIEKLSEELDMKSKQLECKEKHENDLAEAMSQDIVKLNADVQRLTNEKDHLYEQAKQGEYLRTELEEMKKSIEKYETLLQKGDEDRNIMETTISSLQDQEKKLIEELDRVRCIKGEKEIALKNLQSEMEIFETQFNDLNHFINETKVEQEKLRKQVVQLKGDLIKTEEELMLSEKKVTEKEEELTISEKKVKEKIEELTLSEKKVKEKEEELTISEKKLKEKEEELTISEKKLKESNARAAVSSLNKSQHSVRSNRAPLVPPGSKEVSSLKEKIKLLEAQIKLKETALTSSENSFSVKEKALKTKIEALESRLEEADQSSKTTCQEVARVNNNLDDQTNELDSLKESYALLESELKEMQERYSEISLKFAEVEGERQQLVMTLRSVKNAKKR